MRGNVKCNHCKISDMNRENFIKLVSDEPSGWLKDAKRRKRWRWLNRLTLKPRIKYYVLKRAFLLWLHSVVKPKGTFYCQREIEFESKCKEQCDHRKEYYAPLELACGMVSKATHYRNLQRNKLNWLY